MVVVDSSVWIEYFRGADGWNATYGLRAGYALLHRDRNFDPFERELGLRVIKP